jgi:hypothetical protein
MSHDWIPTKEADLVIMMKAWDEMLASTANRTEYGWDPTVCAAVQSKMSVFIDAVDKYQKDDSSKNALDKQETEEPAVSAMRDFANDSIRYNDKMPAAVKLSMGIKPRKKGHTSRPVPPSPPFFTLASKGFYQVEIVTRLEKDGPAAIPEDLDGAVMLMQIGGERPASPELLPSIKLITRGHYTHHFKPSDSGKKAYISEQWQNEKGEKGDPAPKQEITIP